MKDIHNLVNRINKERSSNAKPEERIQFYLEDVTPEGVTRFAIECIEDKILCRLSLGIVLL